MNDLAIGGCPRSGSSIKFARRLNFMQSLVTAKKSVSKNTAAVIPGVIGKRRQPPRSSAPLSIKQQSCNMNRGPKVATSEGTDQSGEKLNV